VSKMWIIFSSGDRLRDTAHADFWPEACAVKMCQKVS